MPILSPIPPPASEIAQLRTIALHRLLDFDRVEVKKLVLACQEVGFFYLDIAGSGGGKMLANLDCANAIMRDWFAQSLESKMNTETVSRSHGYDKLLLFGTYFPNNTSRYKPVGKHAGVDGNRDGWEALKVRWLRTQIDSRY
jgi:isopenicillin N synthase-like dioxygenase